jgi:hypothetical protein
MQAAGLNNDIDKFAQVAGPELDKMVAHTTTATRPSSAGTDNPEFKAAVKDEAIRRAYHLILSPARTEALRKLRARVSGSTGSHETVTSGG